MLLEEAKILTTMEDFVSDDLWEEFIKHLKIANVSIETYNKIMNEADEVIQENI